MFKKLMKWLFPKQGMRIKVSIKERFFLISRDITPVPAGKKLHLFLVADKFGRVQIFIEGDDMGNEYPGWGEPISYRDIFLYADEKSIRGLDDFIKGKGLSV